jgi:hypothetical protein
MSIAYLRFKKWEAREQRKADRIEIYNCVFALVAFWVLLGLWCLLSV